MMLLDTNVLSEMRRPERADRVFTAWARSIDHSELAVSAVTILEVEYGARLAEYRSTSQWRALRTWIDHQVLPAFNDRILPLNADIAQLCAGLHIPRRRSERDAMIAATALAHHLTLVTRNTRDFEGMGVTLLNPWQTAA